MIYLISDSELRVLCSASGLVPNVRSPLVEFLAEKTQIEGRMLDENRRGLVELGLKEPRRMTRRASPPRGCCFRAFSCDPKMF